MIPKPADRPKCRACGKPLPLETFTLYGGPTEADLRASLESMRDAEPGPSHVEDVVRVDPPTHNGGRWSASYFTGRFGYSGRGVFCTLRRGYEYGMVAAMFAKKGNL